MRTYIIALLLCVGFWAKAQFSYIDSVYHVNRYNWEVTYNSLKLSEDKFIFIGYGIDSNQNYVLNIYCLNPIGDTLWEKDYNIDTITGLIAFHSCFDQNKNIIVAGQYYNSVVHGEQGVLAKADSNGNLNWIKIYPAPHYGYNQGLWGIAHLVTNSNQYLLIAEESIDTFKATFLIIKTDTTGNELSRWQYGPPYDEAPSGGGIRTNDGGFLFVGSTTKDDSIVHTYGVTTIYMVKTDSAGNQLWAASIPELYNQYEHPLADASAYCMIEDTDGYIICGNKPWKSNDTLCNMGIGPCAWQKCWIGKVRKNDGSLIWEKLYGSDTLDFGGFYSITPTLDGNYTVCGVYRWNNEYQNAACVYKLNHNGDSLWSVQFVYKDSFSISVNPYSISTIGTAGFMVTGYVLLNGNATSYPWVVTIDSVGCLIPGCQTLTATGMKETPAEILGVTVYPNPVSNVVYILMKADKEINDLAFNVYDINGKLLLHQQHATTDVTYLLNTSTYAKGFYLVDVLSDGKVVATRKFVKE